MSGERQVKVLYDERTIAERTEELAREIAATKPKDLLVVAILKGSFMFAADLLRALHRVGLEPQVEFFHLSSYLSGTVSSGTVKILRDIESSVRDRDVLLVDDILESGRTLAFAKDLLAARGARRVLVCTMLEKPGKRVVEIGADFVGFACPDVFVVGYGMDVAHSLSRIAVHRPCRHCAGRERGRSGNSGNRYACLRVVFSLSWRWAILRMGAHAWSQLRAELAKLGLAGFIVPRADEHQNEYVPANAERLRWLTGFAGSAGLALVLKDSAALFVDGRYTEQVKSEADGVGVRIPPRPGGAAERMDREPTQTGRQAWLRPATSHARGRRAIHGRMRESGRQSGPCRLEPD